MVLVEPAERDLHFLYSSDAVRQQNRISPELQGRSWLERKKDIYFAKEMATSPSSTANTKSFYIFVRFSKSLFEVVF